MFFVGGGGAGGILAKAFSYQSLEEVTMSQPVTFYHLVFVLGTFKLLGNYFPLEQTLVYIKITILHLERNNF